MGKRRARLGNPVIGVGYVRVSTSKQDIGPVDQRREISEWALRNGVTLLAVFFEKLSGSTAPEDRPALVDALAFARAQRAGVLIARDRTRIARGRRVAEDLETLARDAGAIVRTVDGMSDVAADKPTGLVQRGFSDLMSEWYRASVRENTVRAMAVMKAMGKRVGTLPFGYCLAPDGVHLLPYAREQRTIIEARALHAAGLTQRAIVQSLAARGHVARSGRALGLSQVQRIIASHATA